LPESAPKVEGAEMAAVNVPALEVGGDFYDFIPVGLNKWGLVIADVSGKGVPAALFMALSRTLVRAYAVGNPTVSEAILRTNNLIADDARNSMFVTLFYGVLDTKNRTLTYVSAGHNPPLMLQGHGGDTIMLKAKGVALGIMPDIELEEKEIHLEKGDMVTLYTDGVTEAINKKNEQFGPERLITVVTSNQNLSAAEIIKKVEQEVTEFSQGQPQFDDITLLILKMG
jgi:phosphoserine phosphatase RsbU/P